MAFPTGWGRRCSITIDHTKVPGSLTNFPVLLTKDTLPSEMFDADGSYPALNGGGDIRFSSDSAGTTQLACEIVSFVTDNNPANGTAEVWVKVPSVSSSTDTVIYVWYNKSGESQPSASDTYGSQNVWDSNFKMVQHLKDATTSTTSDSTSNANNGTKKASNTPEQIDGKIGKGQDFDGNDDYIQITDASSVDFTSEITIEAWIKADNLGGVGYGSGIIAKSPFNNAHGAYYLALIGTSPIKWGFGLKDIGEIYNNTPSTGTWYYVVARYKKNTDWNIYANNSLQQSGTPPNTDIGTDNNNIRIGQYYSSTQRTWDGIIDEVRLSNVYRSNNWIGAVYNNQNSPSTFATEGTPESYATTYTKTVQAKSRIKQLGTTKSVTAKARVKQTGVIKTVLAKARVKKLNNIQSAQAKASIQTAGAKTIRAKSRIKQLGTAKTITAKGRVKQTGVDYTATAKAKIKLIGIIKTITVKGRLRQFGTAKTINAKAKIVGSATVQYVQAKGRISATLAKTITAKANIKSTVARTITAKAKIWGMPNGFISLQSRDQEWPITFNEGRTL